MTIDYFSVMETRWQVRRRDREVLSNVRSSSLGSCILPLNPTLVHHKRHFLVGSSLQFMCECSLWRITIGRYCMPPISTTSKLVMPKETHWSLVAHLIIMFEAERKDFFTLCPAGTVDFDRFWCKDFQQCNFGILHYCNAHHVRHLCTKS